MLSSIADMHFIFRGPKSVVTVDRDAGRCWRDSDEIRLPKLQWFLLEYFLDHPNQVLEKEDLLKGVWKGIFGVDAVSDDAITHAVSELRRWLDDKARKPWCVETVHGRGYRFIASIETRQRAAPHVPHTAPSTTSVINRQSEDAARSVRVETEATTTHSPQVIAALTVIVGDRREDVPETPGDLFAASSSSRDITWLPWTRLPSNTLLWNDKIICATSRVQDIPTEVRDRDLVIVGSPYCNLMTRHLNPAAFFRFHLDRNAVREIEDHERTVRGLPRHAAELRALKVRLGARHNELVMQLRGLGFVDPILQNPYAGSYAGQDHDYATVTFCAHPYSKERRAAVVAGLHLPGTMTAHKMLSQPDFFRDHPAGGVLKITIPDGEWYERLLRCEAEWFTPAYKWSRLRDAVSRASSLYAQFVINDTEVARYEQLADEIEGDTMIDWLHRQMGDSLVVS